MTSPTPSGILHSDVVSGINELRMHAKRLGLVWSLRPATVVTHNLITHDGDTAVISAVSLLGRLYPGARVMTMEVPPDGTFIVGYEPTVIRPGMLVGKYQQLTEQSVPNGAPWSALELNGDDIYDPLRMHDPSVNNTRITPPIPGWFAFTGGVAFAGSATGRRGMRWAKNGTFVAGSANFQHAGSASYVDTAAKQTSIYLNGQGDYVEAEINQESGGTMDTFVSAANSHSTVEVVYVSSLESAL